MYIPYPTSYPHPQLHCLNNVVNERTLFLKIPGSFFRFMFTNFFLNAFSFINNCFQKLNLNDNLCFWSYIYKKFLNKDYMIN